MIFKFNFKILLENIKFLQSEDFILIFASVFICIYSLVFSCSFLYRCHLISLIRIPSILIILILLILLLFIYPILIRLINLLLLQQSLMYWAFLLLRKLTSLNILPIIPLLPSLGPDHTIILVVILIRSHLRLLINSYLLLFSHLILLQIDIIISFILHENWTLEVTVQLNIIHLGKRDNPCWLQKSGIVLP